MVKRGAGHDGSEEGHRLEVRHGRDDPGAAHLPLDPEQLGLRLVRTEFIRDSPARALRGESERALLPKGVHLDHQPVRPVGELLPLRLPPLALAAKRHEPLRDRVVLVHAQPEVPDGR